MSGAVIAGFHALLLAALAAPSGQPLKVTWDCPRSFTFGTDDLPVHTELPLTSWDELRQTAGRSRADYFECLTRFLDSAQWNTRWTCLRAGASTPTQISACDRSSELAFAPLREQAVEVGQRALERGAYPPVTPYDRVVNMGEPVPGGPSGTFFSDRARSLSAPHCAGLAEQPLVYQSLLLSRDFVDGFLPDVMKTLLPICRARIVRDYLNFVADRQRPASKCPATTDGACHALRERSAALINVLSRYLPDKVSQDHLSDWAECLLGDDADPSVLARALALQARSAQLCVALGVGDPALVIDESDVGTGLAAQYRLSHPEKKKYVAELNIVFSPPAAAGQAERDLQSCLGWANPLLHTADGQQLELRLTHDANVPAHAVTVLAGPSGVSGASDAGAEVADGFRGRANSWRSEFDCQTKVHEMFHMLGLADTYPETEIGYLVDPTTHVLTHVEEHATRPEDDCRVTATSGSIMTDVSQPFINARMKKGFSLYPAEYRALTQPGCASANTRFYLCVGPSRSSGRDRHGSGCPTLPDYCKRGTDLWLR